MLCFSISYNFMISLQLVTLIFISPKLEVIKEPFLLLHFASRLRMFCVFGPKC